MSIDGGKTVIIKGEIAHKYDTDKPCPYCGKKDGIYETVENAFKNQPKGVIGFAPWYTYYCIFCKRKWHSWSDVEKFSKMLDSLKMFKGKEKQQDANKS